MKLPRILITAMRSGAGKTMLTCGILKAMKMQEINPASFKCGPDYIDPMFHKTVIGISSYNLDSFLCGENGVREILKKNGAGADISVMEGVMGYYDGIAGISSEASAYDIARITDTPAVMILDCKGLSVSAVPCIQGFLHYKEDSRIKGVILNRLSPNVSNDIFSVKSIFNSLIAFSICKMQFSKSFSISLLQNRKIVQPCFANSSLT